MVRLVDFVGEWVSGWVHYAFPAWVSTAVAHEHSPPPAGVSHLVWSYFIWILAFVIFHVSMDVLRPV